MNGTCKYPCKNKVRNVRYVRDLRPTKKSSEMVRNLLQLKCKEELLRKKEIETVVKRSLRLCRPAKAPEGRLVREL